MTNHNYDHDVRTIRDALWHTRGSRAAVMVGAGFSLNAEKRSASALDFPSWSTLAESLVKRLYPGDPHARDDALRNTGATSGALRLAQEFEAAFGRTVLLNHLRDMLPDQEHEAGALHTELLRLPWADIFTTNYDTLLERAARGIREQRYEVVRCINDLPLKRAPRIIKLHGTLPELNECILTEEDYRTYPVRFSPFVAEVQVAMVESHLCLVGFSGDDPNFLAWSGWVRDRLGKQTLPIYLWTFDVPTTFQTRMLDARAVVPLPLSIITGKQNRQEALRSFLAMLTQPTVSRPRWCLPRLTTVGVETEPHPPMSSTNAPSAQDWLRAAFTWKRHRLSYPGWITPHKEAIRHLWDDTDPWAQRADNNPPEFSELTPPQAIFVLSELLWRLRRSLFPLYDGLASITVPTALMRYTTWREDDTRSDDIFTSTVERQCVSAVEVDAGANELRLELLRHARETGNWKTFTDLCDGTLATTELLDPMQCEYVTHFITYQKALAMLSQWEDGAVESLLREWDTSATPIWALRRGGLLIELGDRTAARRCLNQARVTLREMSDEGTPETWSIEAWVAQCLRSLERAEMFFSKVDSKCQPQSAETEQPIEAPGAAFDSVGSEAFKAPEAHSQTSVPPQEEYDEPPLEDTLDWLRNRSCDPEELLDWLDGENLREYVRGLRSLRVHAFDRRKWTSRMALSGHDSAQRQVSAYRTLRLIEDAGLPLRSGNVTFSFRLAEQAIRTLSDIDAVEARSAVLRARTSKAIGDWFTRFRVADLPSDEVERLWKSAGACARRMVRRREMLDRNANRGHHFAAATELLSRLAIRKDDESLRDLLLDLTTWPGPLQVSERWWLIDDLAVLIRRVGESLSTNACYALLPDLLVSPVPGSKAFPAPPPYVRWVDSVSVLDGRQPPAREWNGASDEIDRIIRRVLEIGSTASNVVERRYLILRLVTLAGLGVLNDEQLRGFSNALFAFRDPHTGFPAETGCFDSVVLLADPAEGVDEHQLFADKYLGIDWPNSDQSLLPFLASLARTGPPEKGPSQVRLRGVSWSRRELGIIASRCRATIERSLEVIRTGQSAIARIHPFSGLMTTPGDYAEEIVRRCSDVIDEVLLQRNYVPPRTWDTILAAASDAAKRGIPLLRIYPKLAAFEFRFRDSLIEEIFARLAGVDEDRLKDGLFAINHWANQLRDTSIPGLPNTLVVAVAGHLDGGYSHGLIHVIDTIGNLTRKLPPNQASRLFSRCESSLTKWCQRIRYESRSDPWRTEQAIRDEIPDLRYAMTRLVLSARQRRIKSSMIDLWIESVAEDPLRETRDLASEWHNSYA